MQKYKYLYIFSTWHKPKDILHNIEVISLMRCTQKPHGITLKYAQWLRTNDLHIRRCQLQYFAYSLYGLKLYVNLSNLYHNR